MIVGSERWKRHIELCNWAFAVVARFKEFQAAPDYAQFLAILDLLQKQVPAAKRNAIYLINTQEKK